MMRTAIDTLPIIEKIYITKRRSCLQLLHKPVDNFQLKIFYADRQILRTNILNINTSPAMRL